MLDHFPVELLRRILEELAPLDGRRDHSTLLSACLVSRTWRQIAQPLLREIVRVRLARQYAPVDPVDPLDPEYAHEERDLPHLERAIAADSTFLGVIRVLETDDITTDGEILRLAERLPGLRELRVAPTFQGDASLEAIADAHLLSADSTPSLQAARLAGLQDPSNRYGPLDFSSCTQLDRLDFVQLVGAFDISRLVPRRLAATVLHTAFMIDEGEERSESDFASVFAGFANLAAEHLQLVLHRSEGPWAADDVEVCLADLFDSLDALSALRTLSLPSDCHPSRQHHMGIKAVVESIQAVCKVRKIKIIYCRDRSLAEEVRLDWDFWRYVRGLPSDENEEK
ncbi:hypothetical protein JCM8097_004502 [Rhodosporidiobolus ruineniae]